MDSNNEIEIAEINADARRIALQTKYRAIAGVLIVGFISAAAITLFVESNKVPDVTLDPDQARACVAKPGIPVFGKDKYSQPVSIRCGLN